VSKTPLPLVIVGAQSGLERARHRPNSWPPRYDYRPRAATPSSRAMRNGVITWLGQAAGKLEGYSSSPIPTTGRRIIPPRLLDRFWAGLRTCGPAELDERGSPTIPVTGPRATIRRTSRTISASPRSCASDSACDSSAEGGITERFERGVEGMYNFGAVPPYATAVQNAYPPCSRARPTPPTPPSRCCNRALPASGSRLSAASAI